MILVDTSIWADHLHRPIESLLDAIGDGSVVHHPFVTGELALGNPANRMRLVEMLDTLPQARVVDQSSLISFVEAQGVGGTGVGFVDAHLLASAFGQGLRLWTTDKRLLVQAERLDLSHLP
ncbi:MAG: type II toxin-antitoxin system VapC family toxin [Novosphingobium sp.]